MTGPPSMTFLLGKFALVTTVLGMSTYWAAFGWLVYSAPLTWGELDLNKNGEVTFGEASYAASFGERTIQVDDKQCTEYFAYKDGLPLKVVCPATV
jgi:hypothetical protein